MEAKRQILFYEFCPNKYELVLKKVLNRKDFLRVFDFRVRFNDNYICSIGDIRYKDFPTYFKERGAEYAERRRDLYNSRHMKHRDVLGSKSFYASRLLW